MGGAGVALAEEEEEEEEDAAEVGGARDLKTAACSSRFFRNACSSADSLDRALLLAFFCAGGDVGRGGTSLGAATGASPCESWEEEAAAEPWLRSPPETPLPKPLPLTIIQP